LSAYRNQFRILAGLELLIGYEIGEQEGEMSLTRLLFVIGLNLVTNLKVVTVM